MVELMMEQDHSPDHRAGYKNLQFVALVSPTETALVVL
jgi:hypothetical protein